MGPRVVLGVFTPRVMLPPPTCPPGTESFGLFSCMVNGEEREQTHRAVFR